MRKFARTLAATGAGLMLATSSAQSQTLFTGSGCADDQFLFCASWAMTYIDPLHLSLFVTNTSQGAPFNNSAFTQVAIGNLGLADPTGMDAVLGWQLDADVNGFNGFGLLDNQFGIITNGVNLALVNGASQTFTFNFGSSLGTFEDVQTAFSGAQIAIKNQGSPISCGSSKVVMVGNAAGQSNLACGVGIAASTVVPEPSTYALMAAGLAGLCFAARRRRGA